MLGLDIGRDEELEDDDDDEEDDDDDDLRTTSGTSDRAGCARRLELSASTDLRRPRAGRDRLRLGVRPARVYRAGCGWISCDRVDRRPRLPRPNRCSDREAHRRALRTRPVTSVDDDEDERLMGLVRRIQAAAAPIGPNPFDSLIREPFFSARTNAGKTVTVDTALRFDAVWACIRLRANSTCSNMPIRVYERLGDDDYRKARNQRVIKLLRKPNREHNRVERLPSALDAHQLAGQRLLGQGVHPRSPARTSSPALADPARLRARRPRGRRQALLGPRRRHRPRATRPVHDRRDHPLHGLLEPRRPHRPVADRARPRGDRRRPRDGPLPQRLLEATAASRRSC
jgi:hypothetical protein